MVGVIFVCTYGSIASATIHIVSAENVYGVVAKELGGPYVEVVNILNNPSQDPHLFALKPTTAKDIMQADVIIYNGADYDPWIKSLLTNKSSKRQDVIVVAQLVNSKPGDNPHLWYLPDTIPRFAQHLVVVLSQRDPQHQQYFEQQLVHFKNSYQRVTEEIKQIHDQFHGTAVIATEPVFHYMAKSLGLQMRGEAFQMSVMNDIPPSISQIKQFEDDLHHHAVRVLIYNTQVISPLTQRMRSIAKKEKIPVVGVTEMMPSEMTYIQWIMNQLTELKKALEQEKR